MKKILVLILIIMGVSITNTANSQNINKQKHQLGVSYEQNGMLKEAETIFEELIKSEPNNKDYFNSYSQIMKKQNKYAELTPIVEKFYQNNKNIETANILAELYWRAGKTEQANEMWDKALDFDSDSQISYLAISQTQIELRLFDKAISTLKLGREELNDSFIFSDQLIKLFISTNNYKSGFEEVVNALKNNMDIATAQGRVYALMSNEEATDYLNSGLKDLADMNPQALAYQELYAWFLRTTQRLDEALEIYIRMDELKKTNGYELINFATMSTRDGHYEVALKAYDLIIARGKKNPYYSSAIYGYTKALDEKIAKNDVSQDLKIYHDIIERYYKIIEEYPRSSQSADSRFRIALIYGEKLNDIESAMEELQLLNKEFPNTNQSINGTLKLGKYYLMSGEVSKAKSTYQSIMNNNRIANSNQIDEANFNLALCDYYSGNIEEAKNRFLLISKNSEANSANDALMILNFLEENKTFVEPINTFIEAEYKKFQKDYEKAFKLYIKTSESAENSALGEQSLYEAAMIKFKLGEYSAFRETINSIIKKYPNTLKSDEYIYHLGESFFLEKNDAESLRYFAELLTKYPNSIYLNDARKKIRILRKEKV